MSVLRIFAATALLGTALTARSLLPRSPLPVPDGPHGVGTHLAVVEGTRRLPVQIWYPTDDVGEPAPWLADADGLIDVITERSPVPGPILGHLGRVASHAVRDATPVTGPWPVVVLVHGWTGFGAVHANLAEQLASEGHVVVAADHVGGAMAAMYPDGSVIGLDPTLLPPEGTPDYWARAEALVGRYAQDLEDVLDGLAASLSDVGLDVDMTRVRLIGHSTGGGAAVLLAARDARVIGVVGLDPWVRPIPASLRQPSVPVIAIRSAAWVGNDNDQLLAELDGVELRTIPGSAHSDFTVIGFLSRAVRWVGYTKVDPLVPHRAALQAFADLPTA